jgi:hypothetical protein
VGKELLGGLPFPFNQEKPPDVAKMSDKEFQDFVLKTRMTIQLMKPMIAMVLNDMKIKSAFKLPGEIAQAKGVKKDSDTEASFMFDGNEIMKDVKKILTDDMATMKKTLTSSPEKLKSFGLSPKLEEDITIEVRKLGKPLFDYDKEVKEARAAYPELRKKLKLDADTKLPGEK